MTMQDIGFAEAQIVNLDHPEQPIVCMFRPKEFSLNKTNSWHEKDIKKGNVSKLTFGGGKPADLKMQLFFDTYETGQDVRDYTNKVWELMEVSGKGEPPRCQFKWGTYVSFEAVVTSISQQFTLFLPTGTPVRSTLDVSFKQKIDVKKRSGQQSPTTITKPGYRARRVSQGETLEWIAFDEYGDPGKWRLLAEVNALDDPMALEAGMTLAIPPVD